MRTSNKFRITKITTNKQTLQRLTSSPSFCIRIMLIKCGSKVQKSYQKQGNWRSAHSSLIYQIMTQSRQVEVRKGMFLRMASAQTNARSCTSEPKQLRRRRTEHCMIFPMRREKKSAHLLLTYRSLKEHSAIPLTMTVCLHKSSLRGVSMLTQQWESKAISS